MAHTVSASGNTAVDSGAPHLSSGEKMSQGANNCTRSLWIVLTNSEGEKDNTQIDKDWKQIVW